MPEGNPGDPDKSELSDMAARPPPASWSLATSLIDTVKRERERERDRDPKREMEIQREKEGTTIRENMSTPEERQHTEEEEEEVPSGVNKDTD
jgi:hypothetical protein